MANFKVTWRINSLGLAAAASSWTRQAFGRVFPQVLGIRVCPYIVPSRMLLHAGIRFDFVPADVL